MGQRNKRSTPTSTRLHRRHLDRRHVDRYYHSPNSTQHYPPLRRRIADDKAGHLTTLATKARGASDSHDSRALLTILRRLRRTTIPTPNLHDDHGRPVTTDTNAAAAYAAQFA